MFTVERDHVRTVFNPVCTGGNRVPGSGDFLLEHTLNNRVSDQGNDLPGIRRDFPHRMS